VPWPARIVEPAAQIDYYRGTEALRRQRFDEADSLLRRAAEAQSTSRGALLASVAYTRARVAYLQARYDLADSLNRLGYAANGDDPSYWSMVAALEMLRGNRAAAAAAVRHCLSMDPTQPEALRIARALAGQ
jgi:predicted Zn-dependent protease